MPTPLCDALRAYGAKHPLRLHMPGHHGKKLSLLAGWGDFAALDVTELPPTGDLFSPFGPIEEAEKLWAHAFGMQDCLFLTGGSTQGLHAALTLACRPGGSIVVDRGSHRSVYNALALLDLRPSYLVRPWLGAAGVTGPISPQSVEKMLEADKSVKTVCITSPTYYGVLSDIAAIAAVVHAHGGMLVVDGAHGAHLPFLGVHAFDGADLVVVSAHKTLPAPGQTALLFSSGAFTLDDLRRAGALYGSSSPSYPMMAALDMAREFMLHKGGELYAETARQVAALGERYPFPVGHIPLDPTRFVLPCRDGFGAQARLMDLGIYPEMADSGHVVFIPTCADGEEEFTRLAAALRTAILPGGALQMPSPPFLPEQALTPREALFAPQTSISLWEAEGRISAVQVAPYPPGIPVIAPGERVEKKQLSYLREVEYNGLDKIGVL